MARRGIKPSRDVVALTLAIGIVTAINIITVAVLYDALFNEAPGLSENSTQLLTAAFGGIIGVLGSYLGYRAGYSAGQKRLLPPEEPEPPEQPDEGGEGDGGADRDQ